MPHKDPEENRAYRREYDLARYRRRMAQAREILGGCCAWCGSEKLLQIDHVDPKKKRFTVSSMWGLAEASFLEELKKCQLLCRSCHKKKTSTEQRKGHGTWGMYRNRKCRCSVCRAFVNSYSREYKRTKRSK